MKIKLLLSLFCIISMILNAQVGIGTTSPDASASLDVNVASLADNQKKGLLIPRVSLLNNTDQVTIASPAAGLVVYNLVDNVLGTASEVTKDTFYFWDGVKWVDIATMSTIKRELLPQIFSLIGSQNQPTMSVTPNITSADGIVVNFQGSNILLNSQNNITLNTNNTFTINKTGRYEISGAINYNPFMAQTNVSDLEFIVQSSTDGGSTWTNIAKNIGVWGYGTGGNSRTLVIAPVIVSLTSGNRIRCIVKSTYGTQGNDARIYAGTGINYSRTLKMQYLN